MGEQQNWPTYYAYDHKIQRCDATTGHFVHNVAYCDTPERARELVRSINTQPAVANLVKALEAIRHQWAGHSDQCAYVLSHYKDKCDCDWPMIAKQCDSALSRFRELEKAND